MSEEICDIITLAGKFNTSNELQEYCNKQFEALTAAAKQIEKLEEEIDHLKSLLAASTALTPENLNPVAIVKSPEESLCDAQIILLQQRSMTKELTLEETKRLDLLIKNKRLLKEDAKTIELPKIKSDLDTKELQKIAIQDIGDVKNEDK